MVTVSFMEGNRRIFQAHLPTLPQEGNLIKLISDDRTSWWKVVGIAWHIQFQSWKSQPHVTAQVERSQLEVPVESQEFASAWDERQPAHYE